MNPLFRIFIHALKNISLILLFVLFSFHNLFSQGKNFGIVVGPAYTTLPNAYSSSISQSLSTFATAGASVGFTFSDTITPSIGIKINALYSGHNQIYSGIIYNSGTIDTKIKLRYIDIPVLVYFGSLDDFYFEIGPQFSFLMAAAQDFSFTLAQHTTQVELNQDYSRNFSGFLLSADLGVGVYLPLSNTLSLNPGLRFAYSLTDATAYKQTIPGVTGGGSYGYSGESTTKRISLALLIGLVINLP